MGASSSNTKGPNPKYCDHSPIPMINLTAYGGTQQQYQLCQIKVKISSNNKLNTTPGIDEYVECFSSDVGSYYPRLTEYYQQGYLVDAFYREPFPHMTRGNNKNAVLYQAIFRKPLDSSENEESTQYEIQVEKSFVLLQDLTVGIISPTDGHAVIDPVNILEMIAQYSSKGGRLACVVMSGRIVNHHNKQMCQGMVVDLFFHVPRTISPRLFTYKAVKVPIPYRIVEGSHGKGIFVECDFEKYFFADLNEGWKLVDILIEENKPEIKEDRFHCSSLWVFEKSTPKVDDQTPLYEGTVVSHEHIIKGAFGGPKVISDFTSILEEMGKNGWELACLLNTLEQERMTRKTARAKVLLFFHRRIIR